MSKPDSQIELSIAIDRVAAARDALAAEHLAEESRLAEEWVEAMREMLERVRA